MSLREERERLRADIDRILVTAETAEQDAEVLRQTVLRALEIHQDAESEAEELEGVAALRAMAAAATEMAACLGRLHRVHVSSEPLTLPTLGMDL